MAIAREKEIKGWRREKKNKLVEPMNPQGRIWPQTGIRKHCCFRGSLSNRQPETQGPSLLFRRWPKRALMYGAREDVFFAVMQYVSHTPLRRACHTIVHQQSTV